MAKLLDIKISVVNNDNVMDKIDWQCYEGVWEWQLDEVTGIWEWFFIRDNVKYSGTLFSDDIPEVKIEMIEIIKEMLKEEHNLTDADFKGATP